MEKELFDIKDTDIRVLVPIKNGPDNPKPRRRSWLWILLALAILCVLAGARVYCLLHQKVIYSSDDTEYTDSVGNKGIVSYMATHDYPAYTQFSDVSVNDIKLIIYTPIGCHAELLVGPLPYNDRNIILAAQAADYRADNGQISGAFVYKGELLSRGHPKYGFCAIIGDSLIMGKSQETVLFERAVEREGYFFRQFSLIHNSKPGEKLPKGKAIRRALCYYQDRISVIETEGRESMHDFTQALMDMGVQESISIVGSVSLPLYVDASGKRHIIKSANSENIQETYIVWKK